MRHEPALCKISGGQIRSRSGDHEHVSRPDRRFHDEWICSRYGIRQRGFARGAHTSALGGRCGREALAAPAGAADLD